MLSDQERIKLKALEIIDQQVERENANPDEAYKACIWGLHCLRTLVENHEKDDCASEQFAEELISSMRRFQQGHHSEFIDDYNSAKATMGSAINTFEHFIKGPH